MRRRSRRGCSSRQGDNDRIVCTVVNVSEAAVSISISIVIVTNSGVEENNNIVTLPPHEGSSVSTTKFILAGYCRFNFSGAPNAIRANGALQEEVDGLLGSFKLVTDAR